SASDMDTSELEDHTPPAAVPNRLAALQGRKWPRLDELLLAPPPSIADFQYYIDRGIAPKDLPDERILVPAEIMRNRPADRATNPPSIDVDMDAVNEQQFPPNNTR
ncbi:hypothetical protein PFISCL1PPCAC_8697, partial [Pristionchus fissidentatus]